MISENKGSEHPGAWVLLWLAILAFLVLLSQWSRLSYPLGDNEGFYSFYALQMGRGLQLYRDLWDHKPPGLFLQYFLLGRFMPLDEIHLRLYVCGVHFLNAFLLIRLGRLLGFDRPAAWGAAFLYVLLLFPALLQPWSAEADLLGLPFLLAALVLAFSPGMAGAFISGTCFALAFLTKQSAGLILPAFLAVPGLREKRKAGAWAGGAAFGLTAVLFPIFLDGRFPEFWNSFARFNHYYVTNSWNFFLTSRPYRDFETKWLLAFLLLFGPPLVGWIPFLFLKPAPTEPAPPRLFLGLWFLGALVSCFLSAYFFSYYFIALLPPLCLALAYGLQKGVKLKILRAGIFCGWVLGVALSTGLNVDGVGDRIFSYCQYATQRYEADKELGTLIRQQSVSRDRLFCWACEPTVYAYAGLPMAVTRSPVINHLRFLAGDAAQAPARFAQELPRFCVLSHDPQVFPVPDWLLQNLQENYVQVNFSPGTDTQGLDLYELQNEGN
jgi:hypothetical protein